MNNATASWDKFLNAQTLRQTLVAASVFLTAYEMLKDALIDHLRGFYSHTWSADGEWEISPEYREKVLSLDKKEMVACAKWFRQGGALDDDDLLLLKEVADHRNVVAHELPSILGSIEKDVSLLHLRCIYALTSKIDKWWIREIEVPTNPDFDDASPTDEQLDKSFSIRMLTMSLLIQVAEGDDSALVGLYKEWKREIRKTEHPPVEDRLEPAPEA
ncbi:MAG: hypothetical protein KAX19_12215 [Candidatus Brocadiae bacterium]|nr:hypothetical protein [Candidatus Brocadiia bacterium]